MNTPDIWQCICSHLTAKELIQLRCLSKKHDKISKKAAISKSIVVTRETVHELYQIFKWVLVNVKLTSFADNKLALQYNQPYDLCLVNKGSPDNFYNQRSLQVCNLRSEYTLDTVVYLAMPVCIKNILGINYDTRGTENANYEFNDFHSEWKFKKGFWTVRQLAAGWYKLKSHKFENWYEMFGSLASESWTDNGLTVTIACHHWQ